jgi:hypothetical protein
MRKASLVLASILFLSSCNRSNNPEPVTAETDHSILTACQMLLVEAKERQNAQILVEVDAKCSELKQKFPNSNLAQQVKDVLAESYSLKPVYETIADIYDALESHDSAKAKSLLAGIKKSISPELEMELKQAIAKEESAPILMNFKEFHKETQTGLRLGRKYRVCAMLNTEGDALCETCNWDDIRTRISVSPELLDKNQREKLYDLRGQRFCVTLSYASGSLFIQDLD